MRYPVSPPTGLAAAAVTTTLLLAAVPSARAAATPDWKKYVLGPAHANVTPVRVVSVSGDVANARGLVDPRRGPAKLTDKAGGPAPVVLLDYGKDVGGVPYFDVSAASGAPTLRAAYSEARQYAGETGDEDNTTFFPRDGVDPKRHDDYTVTGPTRIDNKLVQGGERYQRLTLTTPGSVTIRSLGIRFTAYRATPDRYQGYFLSSDDRLNRIWYAGAYTAQLNMIPPSSPDGGPQPVVFDGAKRDRLLWSGDLARAIPTIAVSLGGNGAAYLKQSLAIFGKAQNQGNGAVPGFATPAGQGMFYSASYSTYFVLNLALYSRYTGDVGFAREQYPVVRKELAYDQSLVDGGLLRTDGTNGNDWDYYDGAKSGAVTEYNAIYYRALIEGAFLAGLTGHSDDAAAYRKQAADLRAAINAHLYNPGTGVYDVSDAKRGTYAQDANVAAVLYGVAPPERVQPILDTLRARLWIPRGSLPFSADSGYSAMVSPYIGGFELDARLAAGDTANALALMRKEWGQMVTPGPQYTGTFWENLNPGGTVASGSTSLAHAWSSGPTSALTGYVLGIRPVQPGYRTWTVAPHPGDLSWAQGRAPTAYGPLSVSWSRRGGRFTLRVTAPRGTSGTVVVPGRGPVRVSGGTHTF